MPGGLVADDRRGGPVPPPDPVRVWDETTRPTGPAPPPDAVPTARGRAIGAHLVAVHDHLRTELSQVRELVSRLREGAIDAGGARSVINDMTMRQNDWTLGAYCASYCRVVTGHHMLEDEAVFPHLRARDAGLGPVIDRLGAEHKIIHRVLEDVDRALVEHLRNPGDFGGITRAVDILTAALLSHLAYEEAQLVEPLSRHGFYTGQL
jgi:hemerythrin-like domain-containing protein